MKVKKTNNGGLSFFCPGCQERHVIGIEAPFIGTIWKFNGDFLKPTITPSVIVDKGFLVRCHAIITKGKIAFMSDSTHALSGQTVELPSLETKDPYSTDALPILLDSAFLHLAEWLIKEKQSIFTEADISVQDKREILKHLNISSEFIL